jgi:Phenazine biosynthesis-like protein
MPELHVVRVFVGPGDTGGNELGVFLDGAAIPHDRRLAVTAELGFSETVFVDNRGTAQIAIFVPATELHSRATRLWGPRGCWPRSVDRSAFCVYRPERCPLGARAI